MQEKTLSPGRLNSMASLEVICTSALRATVMALLGDTHWQLGAPLKPPSLGVQLSRVSPRLLGHRITELIRLEKAFKLIESQ